MSSQPPVTSELRDYTQLTQVRIPLHRAAEAFGTRDESGRIPIVVMPERPLRIPVELLLIVGAILLISFLSSNLLANVLIPTLGLGSALVILGFVGFAASRVIIPEGVNALLARTGKYTRTIGSGAHLIPPWIAVTHLVTRREIPFTAPIDQAPTQDNVRATINTLVMFSITDPYRFVYNISADDFDLVFQAACQNGLRAMVRGITSNQINDLTQSDLTELRTKLSHQVEPYGVTITKVSITFAQPPADFMRSQEARQLAGFLKAEQEEQHELAARRQGDEDALARQRILAQVERERDLLHGQMEQAEMHRKIEELDAQVAERRFALLQARLEQYPHAAQREWQSEQLAVARALAGNSRAMIQFGNGDNLLRGLLVQDLFMPPMRDASASVAQSDSAAQTDSQEPKE
ncbi:MAG: hypothetical protein HY741_26410 [Chloroflexi bacterium]|nr:hypothetical protein [Chloroflexota bacterium]